MIKYSEIDPRKDAFIFELDDVLYPEKDYLYQIYYLFTAFLESMYRWHQERALLTVRDAVPPIADAEDQPCIERKRPDEQDVARPWLPH